MQHKVRSAYFRESYVMPADKKVVPDLSCPIDQTPLVSNSSQNHSCLACGATYPPSSSDEQMKDYASAHAQDIKKRLSDGQGVILKDIPQMVKIIRAAKRHSLLEKLD